MPITLKAMHIGSTITFPDRDIVDVSVFEKVTPEYETTYVYGKTVPIVSFKNTKRTISVSFMHRLVGVVPNYNAMVQAMFPVYGDKYGASVYTRTPIFDLSISNLFDGYGIITSFTATPDFGTLATIKQSSINNFLFTEVKYTFEFTPLSNSRASGGNSIMKPEITLPTQPEVPPQENYANTPESKAKEIKTKIEQKEKEIVTIIQEIERQDNTVTIKDPTSNLLEEENEDFEELMERRGILVSNLTTAQTELEELNTTYQQATEQQKLAQQKAESDLVSSRTIGAGGATVITVPPNLTPSNSGPTTNKQGC